VLIDNSKGISPLIAAVLLIAFTLAVASLAGPFFTEVITGSQQGTSEQTSNVVKSAESSIDILSAQHTEQTQKTYIDFQNTGSNTLKNFTVTVYGENPHQTQVQKTLGPGQIASTQLSSSEPEKITVESRELGIKDSVRTISKRSYRPFIITVDTSLSGDTSSDSFRLSIDETTSYNYNYTLSANGSVSNTSTELTNIDGQGLIKWDSPGFYKVEVSGDMPHMYYPYDGMDALKIREINQWGDIEWNNTRKMFYDAENMRASYTDSPNLEHVEDTSYMFKDAIRFNGSVNSWDMSNVVNIRSMFENAESFNRDTNSWNTSNVENMYSLFWNAENFNQDLNNWDTSNVNNMDYVFGGYDNMAFNGSISSWDTSNVESMISMLQETENFTQDISGWDTSNVESMNYMFGGSGFNGDISSWDTSKVRDMNSMFYNAENFNQDLNSWDTSSVTDMGYMFGAYGTTTVFNGNISSWNTSNVESMSTMFQNNENFNQSIGGWDTSSVTNMNYMFYSAYDFDQNISQWCVSQIGSEPTSFDTYSGFDGETSKQPDWGASC